MQQNIKNAEEKLQPKKQGTRRQENENQQQEQVNVYFSNIEQIKQHKIKYLSLFLMLLEVIITTVILVLFITLGYVGFSGWEQNQQSNKINLQSLSLCSDEYMIHQSEFIVTKIKTAFIFLCVEFGVAFSCVVSTFILVMKSIKTQKMRTNQIYMNIKPTLTLINILLSIGIILCVVLFGTYLNFWVKSSNKLSEQCRLNVVDREIIVITILLGIKLFMFVIVQTIILWQTVKFNNKYNILNTENQSNSKGEIQKKPNDINNRQISNPKFRQIRQFQSVLEYHYPEQRKINQVNKGNPNLDQGINNNDDQNFKPLKTQDFLLQLKNNQKQNVQVRLFMLKDQAKKVQKQIDPIIEDIDTNRRLMIYQPQDNQRFVQTKKDLNKQINKSSKKSLNNSKKARHLEELSMSNSIQRDQNLLLLINSVNRGQSFDDIGMLPEQSKRRSINQAEHQEKINDRNSLKIVRKYSSQQRKKNFPPKIIKKDFKIDEPYNSRKNISSSQTIKITDNNNRNKLIGSDRQSIDEIKSIIMKLKQEEQNFK